MKPLLTETLFDPLIGRMRSVLDLRNQQHGLTATNLANAETPGFKARTIDFQRALKGVMNAQPGDLQTSHAKHLGGSSPSANPTVVELEAPPWSVDGNSVVLEREITRMKENSLMYRAVSEGLSRKLAMLKYAASDGKG